MPDISPSNSDQNIPAVPILEDAPISYSDERTVQEELSNLEEIDFFISHASSGEVNQTIPVFVENVVSTLRSTYQVEVFFDGDDVHGVITSDLEDGLRRSRYLIIICSPRYEERYRQKISTVQQEVAAFNKKEEISQKLKIIPVLIGVSRERFEVIIAPLLSRRKSVLILNPEELRLDSPVIDVEKKVREIIDMAISYSGSTWQPPTGLS